MEATAASGHFLHAPESASGQVLYASDSASEQLAVAGIQGYAVAIPTMNAIHGQDSWKGEFVSTEYGDHSAWGVDTIVEMLRKFFRVAGAVSLPALEEYQWRLDKVTISCCPPSLPSLPAVVSLFCFWQRRRSWCLRRHCSRNCFTRWFGLPGLEWCHQRLCKVCDRQFMLTACCHCTQICIFLIISITDLNA